MAENNNSLIQAQRVLCLATGVICLIPVSIVLVKVNKRIPPSFFINIMLYTLAILSRAINELVLENNYQSKVRIITTSTCISLIELSLAYFIFQVWAFRGQLMADTP